MYNAIICRYHEIATKGHNRNMFERCLVDNIRHQTKSIEEHWKEYSSECILHLNSTNSDMSNQKVC